MREESILHYCTLRILNNHYYYYYFFFLCILIIIEVNKIQTLGLAGYNRMVHCGTHWGSLCETKTNYWLRL